MNKPEPTDKEQLAYFLRNYKIYFDPMCEVYWMQGRMLKDLNTTIGRILIPYLMGSQSEEYVGLYDVLGFQSLVEGYTSYTRYDIELLEWGRTAFFTAFDMKYIRLLESSQELVEYFKDHNVELKVLPEGIFRSIERDKDDWDRAQRMKKAYIK